MKSPLVQNVLRDFYQDNDETRGVGIKLKQYFFNLFILRELPITIKLGFLILTN